ncbi:MAG: SUMF1/EgtB/PvdO family nonheme iron enzyme, partial [Chloroflexi bacterium]|nr:SUMF1/EgtB/PvdO family nonheme iron enzyme [Chloroflexota bacterium]
MTLIDFEDLERRYQAAYDARENNRIGFENFENAVANLTGVDAEGRQWRIDRDGHWRRREGELWIEDTPPHRVEEPSVGFGAWFAQNWGYGLVGVSGATLVIALVFLLIVLGSGFGQQAETSETALPTLAPVINPPLETKDLPQETPSAPTLDPTQVEPTALPPQLRDERDIPMVLVPEGSFMMGSDEDEIAYAYEMCETIMTFTGVPAESSICPDQGFEWEGPTREVFVSAFYIDQFEVTHETYAAFLRDQGNQLE